MALASANRRWLYWIWTRWALPGAGCRHDPGIYAGVHFAMTAIARSPARARHAGVLSPPPAVERHGSFLLLVSCR